MSIDANQLKLWKEQVLRNKWLLLAPIVACTLLAVGYALLVKPKWTATQAVMVREELTGRETVKLGRFDSLDQMKTVQETILETCKSPSVLRKVLSKVGPRNGKPGADWPSISDIEQLQEMISVSAPNGAEFGHTEIMHISVKNESRDRAVALVKELADAVKVHFTLLRSARAESMEKESLLAANLHQQQVDAISTELIAIEERAGVDLGELRSLSNPVGGGSTLQAALTNTRSELRGATGELETLKKQYELLKKAEQNPNEIISTPNELLVAQPSLKRLKEGLIDAQLNKASVMGTFTEVHPRAKVALQAEQHVREQLIGEIGVSLVGLNSQIEVAQARVARLENYVVDVENRLQRLSSVRTKYDNHSQDLASARQDLAAATSSLMEARSIRQASESSSQIVAVDQPLVGSRPGGIGKAKTCLIGLFCGLAMSCGLFMFVTAPKPEKLDHRKFVQDLLRETAGKNPAANTRYSTVATFDLDVPVREFDLEQAEANGQDIDQLIEQLKEYEEAIDARLTSV
jgi:uncharacterized protein involved in exopolysaccharide biosynthesis